AAPRPFTADDDRAVRGVLAAQQAAWNRGDLDGFMAGYAHDDGLVFTSGGKIRRGWQDTYDKYRAKYGADRSTMGQLGLEVVAVQSLGGAPCHRSAGPDWGPVPTGRSSWAAGG